MALHGTRLLSNDSGSKVLHFEHLVELGDFKPLVDVQLVLNVQEPLKSRTHISLAFFVLLRPAFVKVLIEGTNFVLVFNNHMIDLYFDTVAPGLQELGLFALLEFRDRLSHSCHLRVAIKRKGP